ERPCSSGRCARWESCVRAWMHAIATRSRFDLQGALADLPRTEFKQNLKLELQRKAVSMASMATKVHYIPARYRNHADERARRPAWAMPRSGSAIRTSCWRTSTPRSMLEMGVADGVCQSTPYAIHLSV